MKYEPLSNREEQIATGIVDAAYNVHKNLRSGPLEKIHEVCFCLELSKMSFRSQRQVNLPLKYGGIIFDEGLRRDILVENLVICELKAVTEVNQVWEAQLLSQLKLTGKRLGFVINFNVPIIRKGIKRMIL